MSAEFDTSKLDSWQTSREFLDGMLLPPLQRAKARMKPNDSFESLVSEKVHNDSYQELRGRILKFGEGVFPGDTCIKDPRSNLISLGIIYTYRVNTTLAERYGVLPRRETRALTYWLVDAINLEGGIATATLPDYELRRRVDERFLDECGDYVRALPIEDYDSHDVGLLLLGAGLVLTLAQDMYINGYDGAEHSRAQNSILEAANSLVLNEF